MNFEPKVSREARTRVYYFNLPVNVKGEIMIAKGQLEIVKYTPHFYIEISTPSPLVNAYKVDLRSMVESDPDLWEGFRVVTNEMINNVNIKHQLLAPHPHAMKKIKHAFTEAILIGSIYIKGTQTRSDNKVTLYYYTDRRHDIYKYNYLVAEYRYVTGGGMINILTKAFVIEVRDEYLIDETMGVEDEQIQDTN